MLRITILLFLSFFLSATYAQDCGTLDHEMEESLKDFNPYAAQPLSSSIIYVPFTIHFVKNTDGSFGNKTSLDQMYHNMIMANAMYAQIGVQFYIDGDIDEVNNTKYLEMVRYSDDHDELRDVYRNDNTLNIWVFDKFIGTSIGGVAGVNYGMELLTLSHGTFVHEAGHLLGLPHTFSTSGGAELVRRTGGNCATAGDKICDTEADPKDMNASDITGEEYDYSGCEMTSITRDINGDLFIPPFQNYMSYYSDGCGMHFTPGQYSRMSAIANQFYTSFDPITGSGISTKPTNLSIVNKNGYDELTWNNASGAVATVLEKSTDNGATWNAFGGTVGNNRVYILNGTKNQTVLLRARHLNSLAYSNSISYTPGVTTPSQPYTDLRPENTIGNIGEVEIENTDIINLNNINEEYSLRTYNSGNELIQGGTYTVNMDKIWINNSSRSSYFAVWIDKNQDGDFNDNGEALYDQRGQDWFSAENEFKITIPQQTNLGQTKMRFRSFNQNTFIGTLDYYGSGETEDYVVNVVDEPTPPESLIALYNSNSGEVDLSWTSVETDYAFTIERSEDGFTFNEIGTTQNGTITSFSDPSLKANSTYEYRVKFLNGATYTNIEKITVGDEATLSYCTPLSRNGCVVYHIASFEVNAASFSKTSTSNECGGTSSGYTDYSTSDTLNVTAGQTYSFNIFRGGSSGFEFVEIYADFDQDGDFDESEKIFDHADRNNDATSGSFSVPTEAKNGNTRIRVRAYLNSISDACSDPSYGETEDYTLKVSGGKTESISSLSFTNITNNSMTLNWVNNEINNTGFKILYSKDGTNWTTVNNIGENESSFTVNNLDAGTKYVFNVISTGSIDSDPFISWETTKGVTVGFDVDLKIFEVYPNPARELFKIAVNKTVEQVRILSLLGNEIMSYDEADYYSLNGLEPGVYLVEVEMGGANYQERIVVE